MANPTPVEPEAPRPWYAGLIGFVFAAIVVTALGLATAASYDSSDDDHGSEYDDDADHSEEEDDHSGEEEEGDHSE